MKLFAKILSVAALLVAAAPFASAATIVGVINSGGTYSPVTPPTATTITLTTGSSDNATFNGVAFTPAGIAYSTVSTSNSNGQVLFTLTNGGGNSANTLTFTTSSVSYTTGNGGNSYNYTYNGTLAGTLNGSAVTSGFTYYISTTPSGNVTGYGVLSPTPEPSSLALLGTGLAGIAGFARRRFKK